MVTRLRINLIAAGRLNRQHDIAKALQRQGEPVTVAHGVIFRRAPAVFDLLPQGFGQAGIMLMINCERQRDINPAAVFIGTVDAAIGGDGKQRDHAAGSSGGASTL